MMKQLLAGFAIILGATTIAVAQTAPQLAIDVLPGAFPSNPNQPVVIGDTMYFCANTPSQGRELYKFDSTTATLIADIYPGSTSGMEIGPNLEIASQNGKLIFVATAPGTGRELWEYSPATGARLVADIVTGAGSSSPLYMRTIRGKVYFGADYSYYRRLFIYDGVNPPVNPASGLVDYPKYFTEYNGKIYMSATWTNVGEELCVYDSATNSCSLVKNIKTIGNGSPYGLLTYGSKLYFGAASDSNGFELHSYDGTNVSRLTDINTGVYNGVLSAPIAYKGKLYFAGSTAPSQSTSQLWSYDTATQTSSMFMDMYPGGDAKPQTFFIFKDLLYFSAADASRGRELWVYDGTNPPTPVTDINPGSGSSFPADFVVYRDELYFAATSPSTGFEWYVLRDTTSTTTPTVVRLTPERLQCTASPNPAQRVLTISWQLARPASIGIRLADANGRTVWSTTGKSFAAGPGRAEVPMSELRQGLYFYQLIGADGSMLANGSVVKQ
jgi:ELWxxDGT repeat protein